MKKRLIIAIVIASMLILTGCFGGGEVAKTTEDVDKSTRIITMTEVSEDGNISISELHYIKDDKVYEVWFSQNLRPALDWLRENSKPGDKVLTWWDNGHIIRGYARREPIIYTPCREILKTVAKGKWDEEKLGQFSSKDDATNVAYALLADSPTITQGIMKRYGTKWAFAARIDQKKVAGMVMLLGENIDDYISELDEPKEGVMNKVLFKMADGWPIKGFRLRYQDDYAYVYELAE